MTTEPPVSEHSLHPDEALSVVADEQRRTVLHVLEAADEETVDVGTLVDHVAERVGPEDGRPPDEQYRRRIHIELHHTQLPKLAENGLVAYDTEDEQVRNVTDELVRDLLSVVEPHDYSA